MSDQRNARIIVNWLRVQFSSAWGLLFLALFLIVGAALGPGWYDSPTGPAAPLQREQVERCQPISTEGVDVEPLLTNGWELDGESIVPPGCEAVREGINIERGATP